MRKLNDEYMPQPLQVTSNSGNYMPMPERIEQHFKPTDTGLRLQQLIAYFSQLQGETVDAEWVVKFCVDQIYKDTHTSNPNTGRCRVFTRI
ncbi:hypothetical protein [Microbulbifer sp. Q7]|uniref:hypothetical protein n=1 Tax=Microbulbifer sp. Q7 TaxID=1785091 RepID=UPI00082FDD50|nr:hypothetical protein [Microbulbifer sp. Q7]